MDILQLLGSKLYIFLLAIAAVQTAGRKGLHFLRKPMCTLGVKWRKKSKKILYFLKFLFWFHGQRRTLQPILNKPLKTTKSRKICGKDPELFRNPIRILGFLDPDLRAKYWQKPLKKCLLSKYKYQLLTNSEKILISTSRFSIKREKNLNIF